jgi:pyridoxal phosphate enzyme (YggS family)
MISKSLSCNYPFNQVIENYNILKTNILHLSKHNNSQESQILIASKYFDKKILDKFIHQTQHQLFGENLIQDAQLKWTDLKKKHPTVKLHFIGKLQSNKIKSAVKLFHTIETVSSIKTAMKIKIIAAELSLPTPEIYLQINIGAEANKNGLTVEEFPESFQKINQIIPIRGIMCIPPQQEKPYKFFKQMSEIAQKFSIKNISMGMSNDYQEAIKYGSTQIRVGRMLLSNK